MKYAGLARCGWRLLGSPAGTLLPAWISFVVFLGLGAQAQQEKPSVDDLINTAEQWAAENLDEDFLEALQGPDQEKARQFLEQLQKEFQKEYVLDLAALKETLRTLLPLLDQYEETAPYAIWLRTRLDYFDIADQLTQTRRPAAPKTEQLVKVLPPSTDKLREVWIKKVERRPWPEHAKPFVSQLKPVFAEERVPPELIWIAEVESSFDPRARSPAGAAGLFQLMPATAKQYGLRTWPFDQRLKAEPSARAAARHLAGLYRRYKDWRLALAAYNAGQGTVDRLLARKNARQFEDIAKELPAETQMYVPKFEATLLRREGLALSELKLPKTTSTKQQ